MKKESYWIRIYDLVFTCLIISSILYSATTIISKDISPETIDAYSFLVSLILIWGILIDYYLHKIGDLKKLGNKIIALICFFMIFISYGTMFELGRYISNSKIINSEMITKYIFYDSIYLFVGLLGFSIVFLFALNYYGPVIKSHFQQTRWSRLVNHLNIFFGIYVYVFISMYLERRFGIEYPCKFLWSFIILIFIFVIFRVFDKLEKICPKID